MIIITAIAYLISMFFLFLLFRVLKKNYKENKYGKNLKKRSDEIKKNRKKFRANGDKEFTFDNGRVIILAPNYKAANKQFQTNHKNGRCNL
jgi:hypothetical protein